MKVNVTLSVDPFKWAALQQRFPRQGSKLLEQMIDTVINQDIIEIGDPEAQELAVEIEEKLKSIEELQESVVRAKAKLNNHNEKKRAELLEAKKVEDKEHERIIMMDRSIKASGILHKILDNMGH